MKRAFEVKETFFLVSQQLSFRLKKQTCKNVADKILSLDLTTQSFNVGGGNTPDNLLNLKYICELF